MRLSEIANVQLIGDCPDWDWLILKISHKRFPDLNLSAQQDTTDEGGVKKFTKMTWNLQAQEIKKLEDGQIEISATGSFTLCCNTPTYDMRPRAILRALITLDASSAVGNAKFHIKSLHAPDATHKHCYFPSDEEEELEAEEQKK